MNQYLSPSDITTLWHRRLHPCTHPKQIHHSRCIPNITTLRKDSLFVKLDRDLSQAHSVGTQLSSAYGRGLLVPNGGRSRSKSLSFRRGRLARTLWIADSCA